MQMMCPKQLKTLDHCAQEIMTRNILIRVARSIVLFKTLWLKVVTLHTTMAQEAFQYTVLNSQMKTSKLDTQREAYSAWLMQVQAPMEANSLSHSVQLTG